MRNLSMTQRWALIALILLKVMPAGRADQTVPNLVEQLANSLVAVQTLSCDVRRDVEIEGRRLTTLSRVWFKRGDTLRVETVVPEQRHILADGKYIYHWQQGAVSGRKIPIAKAPDADLVQLRKLPGTADDHLMRLRDVQEIMLDPSDRFPKRRAYAPPEPHPYTLLSVDAQGRLALLEFFSSQDREKRLLRTEFSGWREVLPDVWIPIVHKTEAFPGEGKTIHETLRVSALKVNTPLPSDLFDISVQAPDVHFSETTP